MPYLKPQVSFSLNFASLFNARGGQSFVLFQLKLYLIFTKGTHHSAKFETFDCSGEISPNLYFDRLLLLKVYKVSAKKSVKELCLIISKSHSVHPSPLSEGEGGGGVEPPTKFSKRGGLTRSQLLERSCWERGG